jgi:hypothetical protein
MEKEHNEYIGDIVNGIAKEAAFYKHKCSVLEAEVQSLKLALGQTKPQEPDHYINQDHIQR